MILWKNVKYNLIGRIPELYNYYKWGSNKSIWRCFHYPHLQPWTKAQEDHLYWEFEDAAEKLDFRPPIFRLMYPRSHHPTQQPNTPRNSHKDDADDKATKDA